MRKILVSTFVILLSFCLLGCNNESKKKKNGVKLTKKEYLAYLNEVISYYETDKFQEMSKKYKEEVKDVKDLKVKNEIRNKHFSPAKDKVMSIMKKYDINALDMFDLGKKYNKDPEVFKIIIKMGKYVSF